MTVFAATVFFAVMFALPAAMLFYALIIRGTLADEHVAFQFHQTARSDAVATWALTLGATVLLLPGVALAGWYATLGVHT